MEDAPEDAIRRQRNIQAQILDAENNKKKLEDAINNLKAAIQRARIELANLRNDDTTTETEIITKQNELQNLQEDLTKAEQ